MYNGEKYITRCIESVLNQSYKNIEIIIVDDNSTDSSYKIIQNYMCSYNEITYIKNEKRLGPAQSRNKGLKLSNGECILFLDCDDWIDLNCIEKGVERFDSDSNIDIVIWEIKTAFEYNKISSRYQYLYNNILTKEMALTLLSHSFENEYFLSPLLGSKLYKKTLLDTYHLQFPDTIYEDDMFTFLSFLYSKKIALVTESCLYYYQHQTSITHCFTERHITDFFKTFEQLYDYIDENSKEFYYKYLDKSLRSMLICFHNNVSDPIIIRKYKTLIFTLFYQKINIEEYYAYSFTITI